MYRLGFLFLGGGSGGGMSAFTLASLPLLAHSSRTATVKLL